MKLLAAGDVGMSASVGASRLTNASPNRDLLHNFIKAMFDSTAAAPVSIGQALALAKSINLLSSESNNRVYNLFGDPASYLYPDFGTLSLDNPAQYDTLHALQKLTISGAVTDSMACNGNMYVRLSSPDEMKDIDYEVDGGSRAPSACSFPGSC